MYGPLSAKEEKYISATNSRAAAAFGSGWRKCGRC